MKKLVIKAEKANVELINWSKWDRTMHEQTTADLIEHGMRSQDLYDIEQEAINRKKGTNPE